MKEKTKLETKPPTVFCEIIELKHDAGNYLLRVDNCPYCGKKHYHGMPKGGLRMREFGHRLSHCGPDAKPNPGYFLVKNPTTASKDKA